MKIEPIFKNIILTKFIKNIQKKGKSNLAFFLYYKFYNLYFIKKKIIKKKKNNLNIFKKFNKNILLNNKLLFYIKNYKINNIYTKINKNNINQILFINNLKKITSIFYYKFNLRKQNRVKNAEPIIVHFNKLLNLSMKSFINYTILKHKNKKLINKFNLEFKLLNVNKHELIKKLQIKNKTILKQRFKLLKNVK
jgi:hypothetical protein